MGILHQILFLNCRCQAWALGICVCIHPNLYDTGFITWIIYTPTFFWLVCRTLLRGGARRRGENFYTGSPLKYSLVNPKHPISSLRVSALKSALKLNQKHDWLGIINAIVLFWKKSNKRGRSL